MLASKRAMCSRHKGPFARVKKGHLLTSKRAICLKSKNTKTPLSSKSLLYRRSSFRQACSSGYVPFTLLILSLPLAPSPYCSPIPLSLPLSLDTGPNAPKMAHVQRSKIKTKILLKCSSKLRHGETRGQG